MSFLSTNVPNFAKPPLKVLLVEDIPSDADLIKESLNDLAGHPIEVDWATRLSEAFERLKDTKYDAIMLDLTLPDSQSIDTIAHTRGLYPNIPIVVLTGMHNGDVALQSLRDGAQDYILKDKIDGEDLLRSVQYAIERRRAEEMAEMALRVEAATARQILEYAPVAVARLSINFSILEINEVFRNAFAAHSEPRGLRVFDLLPNVTVLDLEQVLRTLHPHRIEGCELATMDGGSRFWDIAIWPTKNYKADAISGLVLIAEDVTPRVNRNRQRDEFIASMIHDMNVPLSGQQMVLEAAVAGKFGETSEQMSFALGLLQRSNKDLRYMVSNLLFTYNEQDGVERVTVAPQNLQEVISNCVEDLRPFCGEKNLKIEISLPETEEQFYFDGSAMRRVFLNILHNCCKYSHQDGVITVAGRKLEDGKLELIFTDHGAGIDSDLIPTLFKKFWQAPTMTSSRASAGLGLYVARKIVESHSGVIDIDSKTDQGTTVAIVLPNRH
jgi:CheY-like chemotaxis protein/nitrogen-specific signal transduction histidine kinase